MKLQIITFIFLAICLGLLTLFALHEEAQSTGSTPVPNNTDTPSNQYKL